ncbi:MAG TPA: ABC transporter permease [Candidatus Sulfomarinibacteraceae bacterium]|nr:ABC transporter permease [Candidatus Sulfomarinibacteraceae bacterium]
MSTAQPSTTDTIPDWQQDLNQVGLVRRLLRGRIWYGADWWFVVLSSLLLLFIFSMAFFPGFYAPHDPRAEVGPGLLAPGEQPPTFVLLSREGQIQTLDDLAGVGVRVGLVAGSQSSAVLREQTRLRQAEREEEGLEPVLRPRPERYLTLDEAVEGLVAGEVPAIIELRSSLEPFLEEHPELQFGDSVSGAADRAFVLGTNNIGQDVFSRIIWGTRIALLVAFAAAVFALLLGVPLGLIAGYWTGRVERVLTLIMDSLYSFPGLILAIAIAAVLGPGILNVVLAIATLYVPTYYRITRGQTLAVKESLYVEAARSLGARPFSIIFRYILPNVIPSLVVIFSVNVADAILTEAGLAFLGLGLPPDTPDWGIDLARGQDFMRQAWWLITFPGIMITLVTLAFSMLGESLSEILNPRLSET